jgi:alkanesulfonate monooxygenase SsuD/methylene tetrahydromethanopterin reductase-like flavin-dependent oxidoreductase (luciferase family)
MGMIPSGRLSKGDMKLGAHLPLADLGQGLPTAAELQNYVRAARDLGYDTVAANDHIIWNRPWLDGTTALASVAAIAGEMTLLTSVTLPVLRHPAVVAKTLTSLALLAKGPVVGGLGPGSSRRDYDAVGIPFEERWVRFDEALPLVRTLVRGENAETGSFYAGGLRLDPTPDPPPPIWFASWGSDRRMAVMATAADGWLASAYNLTPDQYTQTRARLDAHLHQAGRTPNSFPDAIATTWLYIADNHHEAEHIIVDVLAPTLNRDPDSLRHLPIGTAQYCAEVLAAYADAGANELLIWPVRDTLHQLARCAQVTSSL